MTRFQEIFARNLATAPNLVQMCNPFRAWKVDLFSPTTAGTPVVKPASDRRRQVEFVAICVLIVAVGVLMIAGNI